MIGLPLFPVTTVGSFPRPPALLDAQRRLRRGRTGRAEFDRVADEAIVDLVRRQEEAGCDLVTDGELRRDNFYSFIAQKFDGVRLMTLAEMLDVVEDKVSFERLLRTLDVPAYAISNPTCTGQLFRRESLAVDDVRFLRRHTDRAIKVTLPGPYLLTRAMFVAAVTRSVYETNEDLAEDVVSMLREEVLALAEEGADFVQLDEPVLSELAFAPANTRTFMCAALAARRDPAEELEFAVSLINRVTADVTAARTGVHVCRGNWSRDEATLLRGGYRPLAPHLQRIQATQLVLEYATERAGEVLPCPGKELGLGVVNPRVDRVETPAEIRRSVERALACFAPEQIFLNPDCGFGTFSSRPMNSTDIAMAKVRSMAAAAADLRAAVPLSSADGRPKEPPDTGRHRHGERTPERHAHGPERG
ncbi:MAG TPA: cobalamin-independent methionine synthase II family protein [Gemmatimonadaceae bacterium]|nr:cobalamin-independent methionine synthase II family protein [Gemmatimonadaceae bacterium]